MSRQLPSLTAQGHVHEVLLLQQRVEGRHQVRLVVVPPQAEPLVGPHPPGVWWTPLAHPGGDWWTPVVPPGNFTPPEAGWRPLYFQVSSPALQKQTEQGSLQVCALVLCVHYLFLKTIF